MFFNYEVKETDSRGILICKEHLWIFTTFAVSNKDEKLITLRKSNQGNTSRPSKMSVREISALETKHWIQSQAIAFLKSIEER